jgi:hypothetical protein
LKPETGRYLDKARQALNEARAVAGFEPAEPVSAIEAAQTFIDRIAELLK